MYFAQSVYKLVKYSSFVCGSCRLAVQPRKPQKTIGNRNLKSRLIPRLPVPPAAGSSVVSSVCYFKHRCHGAPRTWDFGFFLYDRLPEVNCWVKGFKDFWYMPPNCFPLGMQSEGEILSEEVTGRICPCQEDEGSRGLLSRETGAPPTAARAAFTVVSGMCSWSSI